MVLRINPRAVGITPSSADRGGQAGWPRARPSSEKQLQIGSAGAQLPVSRELLEACGVGARGASRLPAPRGGGGGGTPCLTPPDNWPLGDPCETLAKGNPLLCLKFLPAKQPARRTLTSTERELRANKSEEEGEQMLRPRWLFSPCCLSSCSLGLIKCCEVSA